MTAPRRPASAARQIESPYLTSKEALVYLRLNSLSSLYRHIRENRLPVLRCGGDLRFDMRELDAWLRGTTAIELVRSRRSKWPPSQLVRHGRLAVRPIRRGDADAVGASGTYVTRFTFTTTACS